MKKIINWLDKFFNRKSFQVVFIIFTIFAGIYQFWPKSDTKVDVHNSSGSIVTIDQTGGENTINNIISATTPPTFNVVESGISVSSEGKYEYKYTLAPLTEENNPVLFDLEVDKDTVVESMTLTGEGKTFGKHPEPLLVSGDNSEDVNHWLQSYLNVPPINLELKIIFNQKPKIYLLSTSALGGGL